jgi:hypothetical protein
MKLTGLQTVGLRYTCVGEGPLDQRGWPRSLAEPRRGTLSPHFQVECQLHVPRCPLYVRDLVQEGGGTSLTGAHIVSPCLPFCVEWTPSWTTDNVHVMQDSTA